MEAIPAALNNDATQLAIVAGVYLVLGNMALATAMFVAYSTRILRKWKSEDA